MYAFVLYDKMNDEYMVARDPFGIIPLYIGYGVDGSVWFSSEMKALQVFCQCYSKLMKIVTFLLEAMINTCKDLYLVVMLPGFYPTGKTPGNPRCLNVAKKEKYKH